MIKQRALLILGLVIIASSLLGILFASSLLRQASQGQSRSDQGQPRRERGSFDTFVLWELHADDTVRIASRRTHSSATGTKEWVSLPLLRVADQPLALKLIGGSQPEKRERQQTYNGQVYKSTAYLIKPTNSVYGYDLRIAKPPHLHLNGDDRLISVGYDPDPQSNGQQIVAVAIPIDAQIDSVYDYQPYRTIAMKQWNIYYYDVTNIQEHISIHISYRPGDDAPILNWADVERAR